MQIVKTTKKGIDYLGCILKDKAQVITRAVFWKIPHSVTSQEDISLKVGRYKKPIIPFLPEEAELLIPKSELTLDNEEFAALLEFIDSNYEPFRQGAKKYIPIDEKFDKKNTEHLRGIFENPDKESLLKFIAEHNILPQDLISGIQHQAKLSAVREFQEMLENNLIEQKWQQWFKKNDWVLGSEFVGILDEREIDTGHISDYLMQAYDGFLDIIEIKRPSPELKFWTEKLDHSNYVPSSDLIGAITQATRYIYEVEREANSIKFLEKVKNIKTIKPRCILIFGRSRTWNDKQKESFRILNSSYHNLSIMTYDHVLDRAKRMLTPKLSD